MTTQPDPNAAAKVVVKEILNRLTQFSFPNGPSVEEVPYEGDVSLTPEQYKVLQEFTSS